MGGSDPPCTSSALSYLATYVGSRLLTGRIEAVVAIASDHVLN